MHKYYLTELARGFFAAAGAAIAVFQPAMPYLGLATAFVIADCYSAWLLGMRAAKAHPRRGRKGRFSSHRFGRVVQTLIHSWGLIILGYLAENCIGELVDFNLTVAACGVICFWQFWSILENASSCNGSLWARLLQRIVVDKTARHLGIDLSELKKELNYEKTHRHENFD